MAINYSPVQRLRYLRALVARPDEMTPSEWGKIQTAKYKARLGRGEAGPRTPTVDAAADWVRDAFNGKKLRDLGHLDLYRYAINYGLKPIAPEIEAYQVFCQMTERENAMRLAAPNVTTSAPMGKDKRETVESALVRFGGTITAVEPAVERRKAIADKKAGRSILSRAEALLARTETANGREAMKRKIAELESVSRRQEEIIERLVAALES